MQIYKPKKDRLREAEEELTRLREENEELKYQNDCLRLQLHHANERVKQFRDKERDRSC